MSKYLIKGNYIGDGVKGLMADGGTKRVEAATAAIASVGGTLECMYFAFGKTDMFAICDFPDAASATAISLMINSTGAVAISLTPLMTAADVDVAVAKSPSYRPPGG
jgi:uncharacterized protein with GYD domain